jgi:hypothetical protein
MIRYLIFYIASALVILASFYSINLYNSCLSDADAQNPAFKADMTRDAELVDYFCLSKRPPVSGDAVIPSAWEKALHASIKIADNAGEACGSYPELSGRSDEISNLSAGEALYASTEKSHLLVYRPQKFTDWFLVISKPLGSMKTVNGLDASSSVNCGGRIFLSLLGALILTLFAKFTIGKLSAQN